VTINPKRALTVILSIVSFTAAAQPPNAANDARIREYTAGSWETLSRSMSECKSISDSKVQTTPVLYLPAGFPMPSSVAEMQAGCHVEVDHLPA